MRCPTSSTSTQSFERKMSQSDAYPVYGLPEWTINDGASPQHFLHEATRWRRKCFHFHVIFKCLADKALTAPEIDSRENIRKPIQPMNNDKGNHSLFARNEDTLVQLIYFMGSFYFYF